MCCYTNTFFTSKFRNTITVPHIVTSDIANAFWADVSINTGLFNNSELAIGIHMQRAIKATFEKYTWCQVIAVIEDDLELAPTYFEALNAVYDNLLSLQPSCFTCVNDLGFKYLGPWDSTSIKPVTNSIGLGFAISRATFNNLIWGIRQWDNFIRATSDMVCYVPEVSLCRHHAAKSSVHGIGVESRRLNRLQTWHDFSATPHDTWRILSPPEWPEKYVSSNVLVKVPLPSCKILRKDVPDFFAPLEKWRGTYNGLVEGNHKEMCSVTSPPHKLPMASINWMLGGQKTSCTSVCAHKRV